MSASAFFHSNTSRYVDVIHCIPATIHPDHTAASQWSRRSSPEKQFDRIPLNSSEVCALFARNNPFRSLSAHETFF